MIPNFRAVVYAEYEPNCFRVDVELQLVRIINSLGISDMQIVLQ